MTDERILLVFESIRDACPTVHVTIELTRRFRTTVQHIVMRSVVEDVERNVAWNGMLNVMWRGA